MSIRFRFRSSVTFDSVDIGGRSSISVRELRAMIIRLKKLNSCQDFDLDLSDADSGREFDDDNFQIPSGTNVVVKRVPAKILPSDTPQVDAAENFTTKGSPSENLSGLFDDFENFGACPTPAIVSPDPAVELTKKCGRTSIQEGLRPGSPEIQSSDTKPDVPAVPSFIAKEGSEEKVEECLNSVRNNRMSVRDHDALQNSNLPAEMKCPLCRTYFKEAVMIPCCQRSFCADCISQVLLDKSRCPECSSDKFQVGNLLPNFALRKTIEHFLLESEMLIFEPESVLRREAPDGESGIQAIDVSYHVGQKAHSPSTTGKGSNILAQNAPLGFPQTNLQDEADSTNKRKKNLRVDTRGVERNFAPSFGYNKVRTCFKCGSPDHLIRDCPAAFGAYPAVPLAGPGMVQGGNPGYAASYWNGASYPSSGPVPNIYTNPGMMPLHPPPFPLTPYRAPPAVPPFYSGFSPPGGFMGMRSMEHRADRVDPPLGHFDFSGVQPYAERRTLSNENFLRGQDGDGTYFHGHHLYPEADRSPQHKFSKEREPGGGYYEEDMYARKPHKRKLSEHIDSPEAKRGKNSRSSGRDRTPDYSSDRYSDDRHKHHHRSSKKSHAGKGQSDSVSSRRVSDRSDRDCDGRVDEYDIVSRKKHDSYKVADHVKDYHHGTQQQRHEKERDFGSHPRRCTKRTNEEMHESSRWHVGRTTSDERKDVQGRQRPKKVHH